MSLSRQRCQKAPSEPQTIVASSVVLMSRRPGSGPHLRCGRWQRGRSGPGHPSSGRWRGAASCQRASHQAGHTWAAQGARRRQPRPAAGSFPGAQVPPDPPLPPPYSRACTCRHIPVAGSFQPAQLLTMPCQSLFDIAQKLKSFVGIVLANNSNVCCQDGCLPLQPAQDHGRVPMLCHLASASERSYYGTTILGSYLCAIAHAPSATNARRFARRMRATNPLPNARQASSLECEFCDVATSMF